jgi:hypothetical protein
MGPREQQDLARESRKSGPGEQEDWTMSRRWIGPGEAGRLGQGKQGLGRRSRD